MFHDSIPAGTVHDYDSMGRQTEVRAGGPATDRFVCDGEDQPRRAQKLANEKPLTDGRFVE